MYFHVEYKMIHWLEAQGYDVTYSTNLDTHRSGKPGAHNELLDHRVFLSVGHDEYWSQEMRDAITAARDAGVHLGFFSANTGYWRIRMEPDPLAGEPDRTMVTYKTTRGGPPDPSGHPTTTWRDSQGANAPENALIGVQYIGDNDGVFFPFQVSAEHAGDRIYRNTGLQDMPAGTYARIGKNLIGWEWDAVVDNGLTPPGLTILAASPVNGELLLDDGRVYSGIRNAVAHTTRYIAPSGAIVFASGTIHWALGLAVTEPNPYIQQITYNLLADMGVQPATPASTLILDGSAASNTAPLAESATLHQHNSADPVISQINVVLGGTTATVTWNTDTDTNGQIWLGLDADHIDIGVNADILNYQRAHEFTLSSLEPNTLYHYQIVASDRGGRTTISDAGSFTTTSGSLIDRLRTPGKRFAGACWCWARENTALAVGLAGGATLVIGLAAWRLLQSIRLRLQRRKASRMSLS
jgi:hypothetical protein